MSRTDRPPLCWPDISLGRWVIYTRHLDVWRSSLTWKKNPFPHPYPLPLRFIWLQCCTVALLCMCMYVCLFTCILTGSVVWLTPPAVSWSRGHMTSWSVVLHHPPRLLPARPHSPFLPPLNHPPFFLIPSSNPLLCFAPLSFWERHSGMGALMVELRTDGGDP